MNHQQSRRKFIRSASLATGGLFVPYYWTSAVTAETAKNDRPKIGAIGVGGRGKGITKQASMLGDVVAVCDVDSERAEAANQMVGRQVGRLRRLPKTAGTK